MRGGARPGAGRKPAPDSTNKNEDKTMKLIYWTTKSGKKATVKISMESEKLYADGWNVDSEKKLAVIAEVEGLGCVGAGRPQSYGKLPEGMAGFIGKLAFDAAIKAKIENAITEIEPKEEIENVPEIKSNVCPKCGTYCYGDCSA